MKKMKKFLGIMLAMVMAVTMLAGCGGSSKESSSSDNGKTLKFGCFSYSESLILQTLLTLPGVTAVMVLRMSF